MSTAIKAVIISPVDNCMNFADHSGNTTSVCLCVAVVNHEGKKIFTTPKKISMGRANIKAMGRPDNNLYLKVLSCSLTFSQYTINCLSFSLIMMQNYSNWL